MPSCSEPDLAIRPNPRSSRRVGAAQEGSEMALKEVVQDGAKRPAVISDCVALVENEVKGKSGLGGVAVKGAYKVVKAIKPGIIREIVDRLVDEFVEKLDPYFDEWSTHKTGSFDSYLSGRRQEVANALLEVTDKRAQKADNRSLSKAYSKLRPKALGHVEAAVPGVGRIIEKHAG